MSAERTNLRAIHTCRLRLGHVPLWWSVALAAAMLCACQGSSEPNGGRTSELVGATSAPLQLGKETTEVSIPIHAPTGQSPAHESTRRVFLHIENITSDAEPPRYFVYLNLPPDAEPEGRPDLRVGILAMFGLVEASRARGTDQGQGQTYKFDVTDVYARLVAAQEWDHDALRVSLVPEAWPSSVSVRVGRISLHIE
jgi:hypothetical protein